MQFTSISLTENSVTDTSTALEKTITKLEKVMKTE